MRLGLTALLVSAATSLAAEPFLDWPLDCVAGQTCYIEDYMDADPGAASPDYTCGHKARADHRGTDFALRDLATLQAGVTVLAAAPGRVAAIRDGVPDRIYDPKQHDLRGQDCGNAVRIQHPNGHQTLYCHMAQGSVAVEPGQEVRAGTPLGRVGLSGHTSFPHLHLGVIAPDGEMIDPFAPTADSCGTTGDSLWNNPPVYQASGLTMAGFSDAVPALSAVRDGSARRDTSPASAPLVLYVAAFLAESGDILSFAADGPQGRVFEQMLTLDDPKALQMQAFGRRAPAGGWPAGRYQGSLTLTRAGQLIAARQAYVRVQRP